MNIDELLKKYGPTGPGLIIRTAAYRLSTRMMSDRALKEELGALADGLDKIFNEPSLVVEVPVHVEAPIHSCEYSFDSDWTQRWTPEESEEQLKDFKFEGPGWYVDPVAGGKVDSILVLPGPESEWFYFHVWNDRDARKAFSLIVNLPTRREP